MKHTGLILLCGAFALSQLAGCVSQTKKVPASRVQQSELDGFAAGAGRPPTADTSYAFARILVSQGRDRDALYVLSGTIRQHPEFLPAYNEMANVYVRADRLDDAVACLNSALKRGPNDGILLNNLGMCRVFQHRYDEALDAFTRATQAMPSNPIFRGNHALALALVGRDKEAAREYRTVVDRWETEQNLAVIAKARRAQQSNASQAPDPAANAEPRAEAEADVAPPTTQEASTAEPKAPTTAPVVLGE